MKTNLAIFFTIFSLILYTTISGKKTYGEIEKLGNTIIVKFSEIEKFPTKNSYFFYFYLNQSKKTVMKKKVPNGFFSKKGSFFYAKYLDKYPDLIIIKFEEEVTDSLAIMNAGFSIDDLKK